MVTYKPGKLHNHPTSCLQHPCLPKASRPLLMVLTTICEVRKCWTEGPRQTSLSLLHSQCVCKFVLQRPLWAWKPLPPLANMTDSLRHCLLESRGHLIPNTPGESPLSLLPTCRGWAAKAPLPLSFSYLSHHLTLICLTSKAQAVTGICQYTHPAHSWSEQYWWGRQSRLPHSHTSQAGIITQESRAMTPIHDHHSHLKPENSTGPTENTQRKHNTVANRWGWSRAREHCSLNALSLWTAAELSCYLDLYL